MYIFAPREQKCIGCKDTEVSFKNNKTMNKTKEFKAAEGLTMQAFLGNNEKYLNKLIEKEA